MLIHYIGTNLREPISQSGFEDAYLQTEPVSDSPTVGPDSFGSFLVYKMALFYLAKMTVSLNQNDRSPK